MHFCYGSKPGEKVRSVRIESGTFRNQDVVLDRNQEVLLRVGSSSSYVQLLFAASTTNSYQASTRQRDSTTVGNYRGTSLTRKRTLLGLYRSLCLGS